MNRQYKIFSNSFSGYLKNRLLTMFKGSSIDKDIFEMLNNQQNYKIVFSDENKVKKYFIEGGWSRVYFKYQDLTEMRNHMVLLMNRAFAYKQNIFTIEGFGDFYRQEDGSWNAEGNKYGKISIFLDDSTKPQYALNS